MISIGLGLILGAGITGGASILGGLFNAGESKAAREEARRISDRDFAYQQKLDRFQMGVTNRQLAQSEMQNQVAQLNEALKTNVGLRDNLRSLYGGRK